MSPVLREVDREWREARRALAVALLALVVAVALPFALAALADSLGLRWPSVCAASCVGFAVGQVLLRRTSRAEALDRGPWHRRCSEGPAVTSCWER